MDNNIMIDPEKIRMAVQNQYWYDEDTYHDLDNYINSADTLTEEEKDWAHDHLSLRVIVGTK